MNAPNPSNSVIVIGAGAVGSTLALALANRCQDLQITIVDPEPWREHRANVDTGYDRRVVALNAQSIQLLNSLGVWQTILAERACAYRAMSVWDGEGTASIEFNAAEIHADELGFIVENSVLQSALHQALKSLANVRKLDTKLTGLSTSVQGCELRLEQGDGLTAALVIGADGAQSQVRDLMGFDTRAWSYGQRAIVTTCKTAKPHMHTAWQRFTDQGPLAFLPLAGGDQAYCSIVWSLNDPAAEETMALDDDAFRQALARAFEYKLGEVIWADERICIPLKQQHVKDYAKSNIVLLGDAAHSIHPLAGQGVNLGLRDAQALCDEILRATGRGISLADASIGRRYQRRVQAYNLTVMGVMEGFKRLFVPTHPALRILRNFGMAQAARWPLARRELMQAALGHAP